VEAEDFDTAAAIDTQLADLAGQAAGAGAALVGVEGQLAEVAGQRRELANLQVGLMV
jgi:hypothetical protein